MHRRIGGDYLPFCTKGLLGFWSLIALVFWGAAFAKGATPSAKPPVFFNHFFLIIPAETYSAIAGSDFLHSEFAHFTQSTNSDGAGRSWSGAYLTGKNTYIEILSAENKPQFLQVDFGIALCVEKTGQIDVMYGQYKQRFGRIAKRELKSKPMDGTDVPWFNILYCDDGDTNGICSLYCMEYHKDYLKHRYPDLKPSEDGITREKYLARTFDRSKLFENVVGITVALQVDTIKQFCSELAVLGYKNDRKSQPNVWRRDGETITVVSSNQHQRGITELKLRLSRGHGKALYKFGERSTLTIDGKSAIWTFQ